MSLGGYRLLLCTNGAQTSRTALDYGVWLAGAVNAEVALLGIQDEPAERSRLLAWLLEAEAQLRARGVSSTRQLQVGSPETVIPRLANAGDYLTIVGPLQRSRWKRWIRGSQFRRLMQSITGPLIYARSAPTRLNRILICLGGLGFAVTVETLVLRIAEQAGARVTLMHVVEPGGFDYPPAAEVHEHWEQLIETDTPQGRALRSALEHARRVDPDSELILRHGYIVHEILAELSTGIFDLVAMGSPHSSSALRQRFTPNVTAEVGEAAGCPLLTARSIQAPDVPQT